MPVSANRSADYSFAQATEAAVTLNVLLRNDVMSAFARYCGYLIILFAVLCYFLFGLIFVVSIINGSFPTWLTGDVPTNRFRNVMELLYFGSNLVVLFVGAYAVHFARQQSHEARRQAAEAERTRKIQVYMRIIDMWNSAEIERSRRALASLARNHLDLDLSAICTPDDFIAYILRYWDASGERRLRLRSQEARRVLDLLEYVGSLCRERELDVTQLFDLLGSQIEQVIEDFMLSHICRVRAHYRSGTNYANILFLLEQRKSARSGQLLRGQFSIDGYGFSRAET
jgi:hypothetical protein